uniref:Tudor domain-containing protein n=1 Tax=Syphacia muris TaxID=451379 RepID=A0A0N5A8U3_9BILA
MESSTNRHPVGGCSSSLSDCIRDGRSKEHEDGGNNQRDDNETIKQANTEPGHDTKFTTIHPECSKHSDDNPLVDESQQKVNPSTTFGCVQDLVSVNRPIKKRYCHNEHQNTHIPITPTVLGVSMMSFEDFQQYQHAMNCWEWASVDGIKLPVILRGNEQYAAVHIVQLKLLSKFSPLNPQESQRVISHKMTAVESWIFNSINAVICKFEYGYQLFTTDDEVVRLVEINNFYWTAKVYNLKIMIDQYSFCLSKIPPESYLSSTVSRVKDYMSADLQVTF